MIEHDRVTPKLSLAFALALLLAGTARADLPETFDWSDANVCAVARDHLADLVAATPDERARIVATLLRREDAATALQVLARATSLDRFRTLRVLDRSNETTVRRIYDALGDADRTKLLALVEDAGRAGTRAGLQQLGVVSDCDDTAFPTDYKPDGTYEFKGSGDFYRLLTRGTDEKGDPGNLHFVTARLPILQGNSRERLAAAGMPEGTFDGNPDVLSYTLGGLDGIEQSKEANIDLWLKLHPGQRFVFLGDTRQRDPEVYRWTLEHHRDQVELVLIHRAGGPDRKPEDYKGEVTYDDYADATRRVRALGIPQPGAKLPAPVDADGLPLPNTDVHALDPETPEPLMKKAGDFVKENLGSIFHRPSTTTGVAGTLERRTER